LNIVHHHSRNMSINIQHANEPVVTAPFQLAPGGRAAVTLPAASVQASSEAYIGLVEAGVGLIPGGGGTKVLYLKMLRDMPVGVNLDISPVANTVFERVVMAPVATSAVEARENGLLVIHDDMSVNPDHLLHDAKQRVRGLAQAGYTAPDHEKVPVVGDSGYAAMLLGAKGLQLSGYASEHDLKIAEKIAYVLSGGRIKEGTLV